MRVENKDLSAFFAYTYSTAAWLGLQSGALVLTPRLIVNVLTEENRRATDLEVYFSRSLGFTLATLALMILFLTGTIPISTSVEQPISLEDNDPKAPYALPVLYLTILMHSMSTISCYTGYMNTNQSGYLLGAIGYGALACLGGWNLVFGGSSRVSARTGEDKRTSGFLFPNSKAYDKKADMKSR